MSTIRVQKIKRNKTKHKKRNQNKTKKTTNKKTQETKQNFKKMVSFKSNGAYQQNNMHQYSWLKNLNALF